MTTQNTFSSKYIFLSPITKKEILYRNDISCGICLSQAALLGSEQKLSPATLFRLRVNHLRKGLEQKSTTLIKVTKATLVKKKQTTFDMIIQTAEIFITKMLQPSYICLLFLDA